MRSVGILVDDFLQHLLGLAWPSQGQVKFRQAEASRIIIRMPLNKILEGFLRLLAPPLTGQEASQHDGRFFAIRVQADGLAERLLGFIHLPGPEVVAG